MSKPRPIVRWLGGKWKLAPWILQHLPPHRCYVEPFGGGGSVLLKKPRTHAEVYNDLDGDIVNFFTVLRSGRAGELVEMLRLTPFARDEFQSSYEPTNDPLERARRLLIKSFMGFSSNAHNSARTTGFRSNSSRSGTTPAADWASYPTSLLYAIERLRGVIIENRDASEVMQQHDGAGTCHYVDPPYVWATREPARRHAVDYTKPAYGGYVHEMTDEQHRLLLKFLRGLEGSVVLSGYRSAIYDEALADWHLVQRGHFADGARARVECLWLNPKAWAGLSQASLPIEVVA